MRFTQARRSNESLSNAIGEVTSIGVGVRQRLWDQMALECEVMAQLALRMGRTIPVEGAWVVTAKPFDKVYEPAPATKIVMADPVLAGFEGEFGVPSLFRISPCPTPLPSTE